MDQLVDYIKSVFFFFKVEFKSVLAMVALTFLLRQMYTLFELNLQLRAVYMSTLDKALRVICLNNLFKLFPAKAVCY